MRTGNAGRIAIGSDLQMDCSAVRRTTDLAARMVQLAARGANILGPAILELMEGLGKRTVMADTALRLSRYLGTSERFWLDLQARYDLQVEKDRLSRAPRARGSSPGWDVAGAITAPMLRRGKQS